MIRRDPVARYVSEARWAVGPARLRAFTHRVFRKRPRVCAICPSTEQLQVAHLVAVSENRALALREKNVVLLCVRCHHAFDSLIGVITSGSRFYADPAFYFRINETSTLDHLLAARQLLLRDYAR